MKKTKQALTPAPWVAVDYLCKAEVIKGPGGCDLALRQDGATAADMRLMAAAPDLLDALIFAEAALSARMAGCGALPLVRAAISAAIKKAGGDK